MAVVVVLEAVRSFHGIGGGGDDKGLAAARGGDGLGGGDTRTCSSGGGDKGLAVARGGDNGGGGGGGETRGRAVAAAVMATVFSMTMNLCISYVD